MKIWNERGHPERNWQVPDVVRKIAERRGISMGQVAIAWVLGRPAVTSVILGARTMDQLNDNLAADDMQLSEDETRLLGAASEPGTPDYPYGEKARCSAAGGSAAAVSEPLARSAVHTAERASGGPGCQSAVSSSISAVGAFVWTDLIPFSADALLSYASLVAITWPLPATRLKWNLPVEPFLSTNFPAISLPLSP